MRESKKETPQTHKTEKHAMHLLLRTLKQGV